MVARAVASAGPATSHWLAALSDADTLVGDALSRARPPETPRKPGTCPGIAVSDPGRRFRVPEPQACVAWLRQTPGKGRHTNDDLWGSRFDAMQSLLKFCGGLPERRFDIGELLLVEGGADKVLYVLIDGEIEVLKGQTQVNTQSEPGAMFGELAVLLDVPHTATVRATVPTRAYVVENAEAFLQGNPDLSFQLAKLLARKLNSITTYLVDLKNQFEDREDHLGMVNEVLESLLHESVEDALPGSERYPDTAI
jgi:CRP-like cAMP-binding protein